MWPDEYNRVLRVTRCNNERIEYSLTYKVLSPANPTSYTILSLFSLRA